MNSAAHPFRLIAALTLLLAIAPRAGRAQSLLPDKKESGTTPARVAVGGVIPLKSTKSSIGTSLFVPQPGGGFAAVGVKLTGSAGANPQLAASDLVSAQFPGPEMLKALGFAKGLMLTRHNGWPRGQKIDVAFSEKIAVADAPATSFASALLVDSMILGYEVEPGLVVIGGFNPEGEIAPVVGTATRLVAALRSGATRIIVPEKSVAQVADAMLSEGLVAFAKAQIFAVSEFDEAPNFAPARPDPKIERAMTVFGRAQLLFAEATDNGKAALADERMKAALREVLIEAPSNLTARLLLGHGSGQFSNFSLGGSIEVAEMRAPMIIRAARSTAPGVVGGLPPDRVPDEIARLKAMHEMIDDRAEAWLNAVIRYGELAQSWLNTPVRTPAQTGQFLSELNAAARIVNAEWPKLIALRDAPKNGNR